MNELAYIELIPFAERIAFSTKVNEVALKLGANPDHLMQVMKAESGLSSRIRNTYAPFKKKDGSIDGYATGLIQFTPDTARSLGTTTWDLEKMSRVAQMDYVLKYLMPYKGRLKTYFDVYLVVFFPASVGKSGDDNYVFETKHLSRASIARSNPAIDINKDGTLTMAEFKQYLKNTVNKSYWSRIFDTVVKKASDNAGALTALFFLAVLLQLLSIVSL